MCEPKTTFYLLWWDDLPRLACYGSGLACLPDWLGSMWSEIFLQMKFIIFQGCPTKQAAVLAGQPVPYNQLLIQLLLLVQEVILDKILKLVFWIFKLIFLRMQISLVATLSTLVLVICLSWCLHVKLSREFLTFISFNNWKQKFTPGTSYLTFWKPNSLSKRLKGQ